MHHRIPLKTILSVALLALWSTTARAEGDYNAGASKSIYCAYCHGYDGNPLDEKVPRLAGRKADSLVARIRYMVTSGRLQEHMRQAIVTGSLGEKEIADLAAFYARQPVHK
ncbi:MAG TPA: hypothetical protein PKH69_00525 [Thiobacillaceae bacterium]|nr:hypothetical protein [Thiobacillaceae bacterium]HNU63402.1 hypothetical protein [Thiobacillaceae bacterium]